MSTSDENAGQLLRPPWEEHPADGRNPTGLCSNRDVLSGPCGAQRAHQQTAPIGFSQPRRRTFPLDCSQGEERRTRQATRSPDEDCLPLSSSFPSLRDFQREAREQQRRSLDHWRAPRPSLGAGTEQEGHSKVSGGDLWRPRRRHSADLLEDVDLRILEERIRLAGTQREAAALHCARFTEMMEASLPSLQKRNSPSPRGSPRAGLPF